MKTSPFSKVSISIPTGKKSKFNLNHDVNTTYDWGSVQPLFGKLLLPDSSVNINAEQLTRLAPMVVPTFGRVKMKNIAHFIPCQEIWPNWDAMMSQTKVTRSTQNSSGGASSSTYVPQSVPHIPNSILAMYCLAGAKVNLYFSGAVGTDGQHTWRCARNTGSWSTPAGYPAAITATRAYLHDILGIQSSVNPSMTTLNPWNYNGFVYKLWLIVTNSSGVNIINGAVANDFALPTISTMIGVPLPNANGTGFTHSASNEGITGTLPSGNIDDHISMEGADLIWEYAGSQPWLGITSADRSANDTPVRGITDSTFDGCKIRLVFKLSSFGKRLRKILIGLGYDVNLLNNDKVSILPLLSFYKSWWDTYAPERYKNFYETNAWKLTQSCMATQTAVNLMSVMNDIALGGDMRAAFNGFMADLGTCFATEKMDCISAATDSYYGSSNTTVDAFNQSEIQKSVISTLQQVLWNPQYTDSSGNSINADGSVNTNQTVSGDNLNTNSVLNGVSQYLYGSVNNLTQPQIDALKKSYIMMNKSSVAGMKVADILRSLGFGDYVEECSGKFVSSSDDSIKISDVVATAATSDAELGQYGGRGLGFGKFQFSYKTNRHGYLIVLSCIVPESGYVNAPAHENEACDFASMYNPELDGLAYEAVQKKQLTGSPLVCDSTYRETFGFLPTYSQWKFMSNKANGDFSLNSRKQYMTPYTLDKIIPVSNANVYSVHEDPLHTGTEMALCSPLFTYADLPNAGEDWRYVNKFPWNGDYNRIFSEQDDGYEWSVFSPNNNSFLYNSFEFDNFMTHTVFEVSYYAHMKPIEDSYGTYDKEHGAPNASVSRA